MLLDLMVLFCVGANSCAIERVAVVAARDPISCASTAQPTLAVWIGANPRYRIVRFWCQTHSEDA